MEKVIFINKDTLYQKYITENLTNSEVAEYFDCGKTTIIRRLAQYGIKKPKYLKDALIKKAHSGNRKHDPELIRKKYIEENKKAQEIAEELNCSTASIRKALKKHRIIKSKALKKANQEKVKIDKNELHDLYVNKNMSAEEIGKMFSVTENTIYRVCNDMGIKKPKELQVELAKKTWIKTGSKITLNNLTVEDMVKKFNISPTSICKFIRNNKELTNEEIFEYLNKLKFNSATSLEYKIHKALNIPFYNKQISDIKMAYKPDFKLTNTFYLNVDGLYWHSELVKKDNNYHFRMRQEYEEHNLKILQFREDEINNKLPIVLSMINNKLLKNNKIYARNTEIKKIIQKEANVFLQNNHIMGDYKAKHIGLYHNKELLMIVSYKIYNKKILKIERLCSKLDLTVTGGFSKLLKYLKNNENFDEIHYWVDLRYGTGDFLTNHGFEKSHETLGWRWTNFLVTHNRRKCRANMDDRKLREREHANELGLVKIYDAGQRLYINV